jgi:spore coat protein U-like protein
MPYPLSLQRAPALSAWGAHGRSRAAALLALALSVVCTGTLAQNCTFRSVGSALNFPSLDPSAATTATAIMDIGVRCTPAAVSPTWTFAGTNGSSPLRMRHVTLNLFISYTVTTTLLSSQGANETWRLTGTVLGANYQNAMAGVYSDILTATITP